MILDDFDSRPGSATSLLRTIVGACLRERGGSATIGDLIRLMDAVGITEAHTRTAVSRVKGKGLLLPGYSLNPEAVPMLERGDRRIFGFRRSADGDPWCLISFSIPEGMRGERHQLRRRLSWIGCGTVSTGLWICPAFLAGEVDGILDELGLRRFATLFTTSDPRPAGSLADAASRWWDLERLAALHTGFLRATAELDSLEPEGATAFRGWIRALDEWRIIPYLDPGLPPSALPEGWPGEESLQRFRALMARFAEPGLRFALPFPDGARPDGARVESARSGR
jgi:phenylacetic acid degradation operon negative regulatory protein